jgi:hypothetical protein
VNEGGDSTTQKLARWKNIQESGVNSHIVTFKTKVHRFIDC